MTFLTRKGFAPGTSRRRAGVTVVVAPGFKSNESGKRVVARFWSRFHKHQDGGCNDAFFNETALAAESGKHVRKAGV